MRRKTNSQYDEVTDKARSILYFKHMDRLSALICSPDRDGVSLDDETLHMELLLAPDTINRKEWDYEAEINRIQETYTERGRVIEEERSGRSIRPDVWHGEKRFYERRANFIEACHNGMLSHKEISHVGLEDFPVDLD